MAGQRPSARTGRTSGGTARGTNAVDKGYRDKGRRMSAGVGTGSAQRLRLAELEQELASMRVRLAVTRVVTRDVSQWVNDDDAILDVIVEDVAQRWIGRTDSDPQVLDGPEGFWSRYANRIEWAPPESGNEFRAEFCPTDPDTPFDSDNYFHAVWTAHVAGLRRAAESVKAAA